MELAAPEAPPLGATDSPKTEPIRFRSRPKLGFPNREIDAVEFDPDDANAPPAVRTTFLGLYGVDARMPSYFIDEVAQNRDGAEPLAAFLDLFHHRIVTQYYRVWRKYRYPAGFRKDASDKVSSYLLSLTGLGIGPPEIRNEVDTRTLLSTLGLTGQRTRTAEGLSGVLQHVVPDAAIAVTEFYPVWVKVNDAEPTPLGENCLLGRGFTDRSNTVHVRITPQMRDTVLGLMPGQPIHDMVMALLRYYLGYEAQAQLEMSVRAELMPQPAFNSTQVRLGYSTLLPKIDTPQAPIRVQLGTWGEQQPM
ncbi:type VI secretion system baseplate subunit TssG [Ralstonia sp. 21MJYT02-11]|uniref:Type VI secretion system baseplate subunit TssG n=2 Tax=Ralstonia soli TaxID=2953896 RepID=A0ABT1AHW4_9RALS|nr:type VI secretion system baseplate subunit TssG [Ralstonia soli]